MYRCIMSAVTARRLQADLQSGGAKQVPTNRSSPCSQPQPSYWLAAQCTYQPSALIGCRSCPTVDCCSALHSSCWLPQPAGDLVCVDRKQTNAGVELGLAPRIKTSRTTVPELRYLPPLLLRCQKLHPVLLGVVTCSHHSSLADMPCCACLGV